MSREGKTLFAVLGGMIGTMAALHLFVTRQPAERDAGTEYEQALRRYQAHIGELARQREELMRRHDDRLRGDLAREMKLDLEDEAKLYEQLRAESRRRPLTFDGEVPENTAFDPASPVSARVFLRLYREGIVNANGMMERLSGRPEMLCREWAPLVQDIADHERPDTFPGLAARRVLFGMRISRDVYRKDLERAALARNLDIGFDVMLFQFDPRRWERRVVKSADNDALVRKVQQRKDAYPEALEACAEYLAETGDPARAEAICIDLLSRPHRYREDAHYEPGDVELSLGRARTKAMFLMFYQVRTPRCFKVLYEISRAYEPLWKPTSPAAKLLQRTRMSTASRMDIQQAQSLISRVSDQSFGLN